MIDEHAVLTIVAGQEDAFEAAYAQACLLLLKSGAVSTQLSRCIEHPSRFLLQVAWPTLETHTENFRGSAAFMQWRALVGPFFASAPDVTHYASVASSVAPS